jgi:hypothetical protein
VSPAITRTLKVPSFTIDPSTKSLDATPSDVPRFSGATAPNSTRGTAWHKALLGVAGAQMPDAE